MNEQTDNKGQIVVTLNNGKKVMNSATIPVEWWFSKEVRERDPKFILFFEQDEIEKSCWWGKDRYGRRYFCEVSDVFKYIELFSSGYHRIMAMVITGKEEEAQEVVRRYLRTNDHNHYSSSLEWKESAFSTVEEFEVPEDLFAKKPEGRVGKLIWRWVNFWFESEPKNKCKYKGRKIFAFSIQPFIHLGIYGIFGSLYATYILLASIATLFVGYRPKPIIREMWEAFTFSRYHKWSVRKYDGKYYGPHPTYRLWSISECGKEAKYMPVTPLLAILIGGAGVGVYYIIKTLLPLMLSLDVCLGVIGTLGFAGFVLYIIFSYIERTAPERKKRRQQKEKEKQQVFEEERRRWLENFDLSKKTDEVYLDRLPTPPTFSGKVVQKFRVSYWTLKAKVCKPYSR